MNRLRGFLITFALRIFNASGQIAIAFFLLKAYDVAMVGFFAIFVSNTMLASLISRQGYDRTLILFSVRRKASVLARSLFAAYVRRVIITAPLSGLLNIGAYYLVMDARPSLMMTAILVLMPGMVALSFLAAGFFTGFGRTVSATVQQPGFSAALAAIVLTAFYFAGYSIDVFATYFGITALIAFLGLWRIFHDSDLALADLLRNDNIKKKGIRKLAAGYSRRFLVINFFTTFSSVYFISFLALFVADELIGEFRVVERIALVIAFNLSFINIILPGSAIRQRLSNDQTRFARSIRLTFLFQYASGCGIFLIFLIFMDPIMEWAEIQNRVLYLLLLLAQLVNALTGPVRVVLMYLDGQSILQATAILETVASAILYWYFYSVFGLTGLAIAYFIAIATPNLVLAGLVYHRYGIIPLPFVNPTKLETR